MQYAFDEKISLPVYIKDISKTATNACYKCLECKKDVNIRSGNKNADYFAHKTIRESSCLGIKTAELKAAKLFLIAFFNRYSKDDPLDIKTCKCNFNDVSLKNCRARPDYKFSEELADIVIINEEDEALFLFEIKCSDTPATEHKEGNWFCFDVKDILFNLEKTRSSSIKNRITLMDVKKCSCPKRSLAELGVKLNYCTITSDWNIISNRIMFLCKKDKNYYSTYKWTSKLNMDTPNWEEMREEFEKRKQCLRCKKSHTPSIGKPYCESCLLKIMKGDDIDVVWKRFSTELMDEIKEYFKWLLEIPEPNRKVNTCVNCGIIKKDEIWFYGKRSICTDCVVLRHRSEYPRGKYLTSKTDNLKKIILSYRIKTKEKYIVKISEYLEEKRKSTERTIKKIEESAALVKDTYSLLDDVAKFFKENSIDIGSLGNLLETNSLEQETEPAVGPMENFSETNPEEETGQEDTLVIVKLKEVDN
jgi:hypothetical protein